ncbi:hypothetical protein [Pseudobutyrivibrio sp.]
MKTLRNLIWILTFVTLIVGYIGIGIHNNSRAEEDMWELVDMTQEDKIEIGETYTIDLYLDGDTITGFQIYQHENGLEPLSVYAFGSIDDLEVMSELWYRIDYCLRCMKELGWA